MTYFVVSLKIIDRPTEQATAAQHVLLNKLLDDGTLVLAGPFTNGANGMAVLRAESIDQVRNIYDHSPVITSGCATFEVREWTAMWDGTKG